MRRRDFIGLPGSAATWPPAARAEPSETPVIGFLGLSSPDAFRPRLTAFRSGLAETGYVEDRNVRIEYRWAEDRAERLPILAADLVGRNVKVIATAGGPLLHVADGVLVKVEGDRDLPLNHGRLCRIGTVTTTRYHPARLQYPVSGGPT